MLKKILLSSLLIYPTLIVADTSLNPLIKLGYDWGGTTLAIVEHEYERDEKIRAGNGVSLEVGAVVASPNSNTELQLFLGYKADQSSASNGEVTWDAIPFTALVMIKNGEWKFGGGVTYHLNPELSGNFSGYDNGDYFNDSVDDQYENSLGTVLEIDYMATDYLSIGVKGTFIEYKLKSDHNLIAKGNSIGLNFSYIFGKHSEFK